MVWENLGNGNDKKKESKEGVVRGLEDGMGGSRECKWAKKGDKEPDERVQGGKRNAEEETEMEQGRKNGTGKRERVSEG